MKTKIMKAAVEGKLLRKAFNKIVKDFGWDRLLGVFSRRLVFSGLKINQRKIFINTFQGDYTCNPKYITEELIRQKVDCEIVWGCRLAQIKKKSEVPKGIKLVDRYTYEFYKEALSSKIWIMNSVEVFKNPIVKKEGQFLIQTWHGSLGIKRFDKGVNSGKAWVKAAELSSKLTDFCISNSAFEDCVLKESFWNKSKIITVGHPRNDVFFLDESHKDKLRKKVLNKLKIKGNYKYVLYAPTFRDAKNFDCYDLNYEELIKRLQTKYGGNWKVLVRFHPTVRELSTGKLKTNKNIIDVTKYTDIQELMVLSDIAITDYSSWIYDFVLSRKPGFIFATDIDLYNTERGFYYPLESTPFPIATNNDELMNNILAFDNTLYQRRIDEFLADKGCVEDGKASYRVVEKIKEIIGEK